MSSSADDILRGTRKEAPHRPEADGRPEHLLTESDPHGHVHHAPVVRAGRWIFASGLMATDGTMAIDPAVVRRKLPLAGAVKARREAERVFARLEFAVEKGGGSLEDVVRVDQFYRRAASVDPYHAVRRALFPDRVPASTSILEAGLLLPEAEVDLQALAVVPDKGFATGSASPKDAFVPRESAHTPAVTVGDLIFVSGQLARGPDGDLSPEARMAPNQQWRGTPMRFEAEYLLHRKIAPILEAAGGSLAGIAKAQVYLSSIDDIPDFRDVWNACFAEGQGPAVTYVPTVVPGFGTLECGIEINVVGLRDDARARREVVDAAVFTGFDGDATAIAVDDLLFISGLMAVDDAGAPAEAVPDPRRPHFGTPAAVQTRKVIDMTERICAEAGTSLSNVVRIQQFHLCLGEFQPVHDILRGHLGRAVPFSAVQVPGPLPVPGCSVLFDIWVHRPGREYRKASKEV